MNLNSVNTEQKIGVQIFKMMLIILFLLINNTSVFGQSMITESSYLENENKKEISYAVFVKKMDTGKYTMIPLQNDAKEIIGYRLKPLESVKNPINKLPQSTIVLDEKIDLGVIYHKHILIPVKFNSENKSEEAWLLFDTGTFIPIIITDEKFKTGLGKIESVELSGFKINNPITGSYGLPGIIEQYNEMYTNEIGDKLNGKKIVGIMGYQLLKDYLVSIDLKKGKIYLKNQSTIEKSTTNRAAFKTTYRDDLQNIWLPVKINGVEGYAHLDTGYPFTWVEENFVNKDVESFVIGGVNIFKETNIEFKMTQQSQNYSNLEFLLIANIGNNLLEHFIITIDSTNKQLIFERN